MQQAGGKTWVFSQVSTINALLFFLLFIFRSSPIHLALLEYLKQAFRELYSEL